MKTSVSRRELVVSLAAAVPALSAAQAQPPDDPAAAVAERHRANADLLAKFTVPMATEPAFQFRA